VKFKNKSEDLNSSLDYVAEHFRRNRLNDGECQYLILNEGNNDIENIDVNLSTKHEVQFRAKSTLNHRETSMTFTHFSVLINTHKATNTLDKLD
jgi:hypothetical protein